MGVFFVSLKVTIVAGEYGNSMGMGEERQGGLPEKNKIKKHSRLG